MAQRREGLGVTVIIGLCLAVLGLVGLGVGTAAIVLSASREPEASTGTGVRQLDITIPKEPQVPDGGASGGGAGQAPDDPAADDGELHDARNDDVGYGFKRDSWGFDKVEHLAVYDADVWSVFEVSYPQLDGDLEHLDKVNRLLRRTALETVRAYYDDPSARSVERVKRLGENESQREGAKADYVLTSDVDYAITYNTEDFLSVCFSDKHYLGSSYLGFIGLRTVNVNLKTGEVYRIDDVLTMERPIAVAFVDNLVATSGTDENGDGIVSDDECLSVRIASRSAFIRGLRGRGPMADAIDTCFFVDGNGRVNLGATYTCSGDASAVSGWWDVTLTDEQLEAARKDSSLWELLP